MTTANHLLLPLWSLLSTPIVHPLLQVVNPPPASSYACTPFFGDSEIRDSIGVKLHGHEICYFMFHYNRTADLNNGEASSYKYAKAKESCHSKSSSILPTIHSPEEEDVLFKFGLHNVICVDVRGVSDNCGGRRRTITGLGNIMAMIPLGADVVESQTETGVYHVSKWDDGIPPTFGANRPMTRAGQHASNLFIFMDQEKKQRGEENGVWGLYIQDDRWRLYTIFCKYNKTTHDPSPEITQAPASEVRPTIVSVPHANATRKRGGACGYRAVNVRVIILVIILILLIT